MSTTTLRVLFALLLTVFVLAPWYAEVFITFLLNQNLDGIMIVLTGLAVLSVALLMASVSEDYDWRNRRWLMFGVVMACWAVGVLVSFRTQVEVPSGSGSLRAPVLFAITSAWLPFLAWSTYWSMAWLGRIAVVLVLLLLQPVFLLSYSVPQLNATGFPVVLRRGQSLPASETPAPAPTSVVTTTEDQQAPVVTAEPTLISNSVDRSNWRLDVDQAIKASLAEGSVADSFRVAIDQDAGSHPWDIQLNRSGFQIKQGQDLSISFRVKADKSRSIAVNFGQNHEPWKNLGIYRTLDLGPDWRSITINGKASQDDPDGRLSFELGVVPVSVEIADVRVSPAPGSNAPPPPVVAQAPPEPAQPPAPEPPAPVTINPAPEPAAPAPVESTPPAPVPSAPAPAPSDSSSASVFEGWSLIVAEGNAATSRYTSESGAPFLSVTLPAGAVQDDWKVRLQKEPVPVAEGKTYEVTIKARSNAERSVTLAVSHAGPPWNAVGLFEQVPLTADWQEKSIRFEATASVDARLHVNLVGPAATVDIARVEIRPVD